jgi:HK97 family phage prohead protease
MRTLELRSETTDGKTYLSGRAAPYSVLSRLWGNVWERIMPGAFTRALAEQQDVRHLKNHDPSLVLGRTKAGTTVLSEDSKGLNFRTLMPDTTYARDLVESVGRGDIDENSFGFVAIRQGWLSEPDPENDKDVREIRELYDVDLMDVSTVTYPQYTGTSAAVERSLFPDGVPVEVRAHMTGRMAGPTECACQCPECLDGDCEECSIADCADVNCRCGARAKSGKKGAKTKRVDGEDLKADCFLIVGDVDDTATWKLPWKFSTEEKTKTHLQNALARFNQLKGVSEEDKKAAWAELVKLCKEHEIEVTEENSLWNRLTVEQRWELREPWETERAQIRARVVSASL